MGFKHFGIIGTLLLTAAVAQASTITSVTLHLSGTFDSARSFLGGDTTDWSTFVGTLTIVNDLTKQTESGGSFPGVAALSLTFRDSSSALIGTGSWTSLDLHFANDAPCQSCGGGAIQNDSMNVLAPLTQSIGGVAAGRSLNVGLIADYQFYIPGAFPLSHYVTRAASYQWNNFSSISTKKSELSSDLQDVPVLIFPISVDSVDVVSDVPEPSSALLVLSGAALVAMRKRWRSRRVDGK